MFFTGRIVQTHIFFVLGLRLQEDRCRELKSQHQTLEQTANTMTPILLLLRDGPAIPTNQSLIEEKFLQRYLFLNL